jgi:segregation and condensation protein B
MTNHSTTEYSLERILEALLSVSESPLSIVRMRNVFPEEARPGSEEIENALEELSEKYADNALELVKLAGGYRFQTRSNYAQWINKLFETRPPKLSRALLETLSIIAYQQPVTRSDIQDVRGVAVSSDIIQRLLEREWIKKIGEKDVPGRPALFGTTPEFLAYFNLGSLKDLPILQELRELDEIARDVEQQVKNQPEDQPENQPKGQPATTPNSDIQQRLEDVK